MKQIVMFNVKKKKKQNLANMFLGVLKLSAHTAPP